MCHAGTKSARRSRSFIRSPVGTTFDRAAPIPTLSTTTEEAGVMGGSCQLHRLLALQPFALQPQGVENNQQIYWQVWILLSPVFHLSKFHCLATREERAHKTSGCESTRLVSKQQIPTLEGHSISEPFRLEEFVAALRRLKPAKSPGLNSIFLEFVLHARLALKSWFCDFLNSCMRQLKTPTIWRRALVVAILRQRSHWGTQRAIVLYLCCVSPLKSSRDSSTLVSKRSSTHCSHRSRRASDTGARP